MVSACSPEAEPEPEEVAIDNELRREMSELFGLLEFSQARTLFQDKMAKGLADVEVLLNYGFTEFKIFQDYASAESVFKRAVKLDPENPYLYMLMGEMYLDQGNYGEAIATLKTASDLLEPSEEEWNNVLSKIYYLMGKSFNAMARHDDAIDNLEAAIKNNPYRTEASMLLHQLYVIKEDYQQAYAVWKLENGVVQGSEISLPRVAESNNLYTAALATEISHKGMAELYSRLRLYDEALLEYSRASAEIGEEPSLAGEMERISTFIDFRDELAAFFEDYYRERCQGGSEFNDYNKLLPIYEDISVLLDEKAAGGAKTWINKLNDKIEEEFGVGLDFIMDSGVRFGLHFGYVADDISTQVSQWGSTGEYRLIILKNMISNGLMHWLSSGDSGVGDWNLGDNLMFAVMYSTGAMVDNLRLLNREFATSARQEAEEFDNIQDKGPTEIFFSRTLLHELTLKQLNTEVAKAEGAGVPQELWGDYVINRYQKDYLFTTIIVHEGQHALDKGLSSKWQGEYEYRAKLSELAYGELQYRTLANLHSQSLDTSATDTHARANARIFQDFVQHILENEDKYPEIDTSQNIMVQLPYLSEGQIKKIAIAIFEANYPGEHYQ